jgi:hypothetical protein
MNKRFLLLVILPILVGFIISTLLIPHWYNIYFSVGRRFIYSYWASSGQQYLIPGIPLYTKIIFYLYIPFLLGYMGILAYINNIRGSR